MADNEKEGCGFYIFMLIVFFGICALLNAMF